jgi:hypothetical protein
MVLEGVVVAGSFVGVDMVIVFFGVCFFWLFGGSGVFMFSFGFEASLPFLLVNKAPVNPHPVPVQIPLRNVYFPRTSHQSHPPLISPAPETALITHQYDFTSFISQLS